MLQWSSCLFATIVLHAYYKVCWEYHHVFLLLTVSSILFHCQHHPVVRNVDKVLAHVAFGLVIADTPLAVKEDVIWLLAFPGMTACLWFAQTFWPGRSEQLHLALHLASVLGMHVYLAVLY